MALEICQEEECIHFQYEHKEDNNGNMKHLVSYSINKVQSRSHLGQLDLTRKRSNAGITWTSCRWFRLISLISMTHQETFVKLFPHTDFHRAIMVLTRHKLTGMSWVVKKHSV